MERFHSRVALLTGGIFFLFIAIGGRLLWLQILNGSEFRARAEEQYAGETNLPAHRGDIFIREAKNYLPIATTKNGWQLSIDPRLVEDPEGFYKKLQEEKVTTISHDEFIGRATKENDPYELIERRLPYETKDIFEKHQSDFSGAYVKPEQWRFYPASNLAAHIAGFVGAEGTGQYGLERFYEEQLTGKDGSFVGKKTISGRLLRFGKSIINPETNGADLYLTIESSAQARLEKILDELMKEYGAAGAGGLIMNPKTGALYALAARPVYDPNAYSSVSSLSVFRNPIVESRFEMGSVVKPLTMAAAIDAGVVNEKTTYVDEGKRIIDGETIRNYDEKARGRIVMQEILSQSLNTGAVFLAERLGKERFQAAMELFGIDKKTGVDLPNEIGGDLHNLSSPQMIETATASFGQGISMTPIGLVRALASIANGGMLVTPYIVESLAFDDGRTVQREQNKDVRILKEETTRTITRMLVTVVDEKLAGGHGKIPGYTVAAKTGTAQIVNEGSLGYSDEFLHSFFGYGPAYDPKFLVFLYLERPKGVRYASETLTEPFRSLIQFLFASFEVPPDRPWEQ